MLLIIILKIFNSCSLSSFLLSFSNLACSIWNWCSFSNLISSSFLYLEDVNQGMQLVCLKAILKLAGILFKKCLQYICLVNTINPGAIGFYASFATYFFKLPLIYSRGWYNCTVTYKQVRHAMVVPQCYENY